MTTSKVLALAVATMSLLAIPSTASAGTWDIDPAHSTIEFSVKHMMVSTVKGQFEKVKGTIERLVGDDPKREGYVATFWSVAMTADPSVPSGERMARLTERRGATVARTPSSSVTVIV